MKGQPAVSIFIVTYLADKARGEILRHTCEVALEQRYPDFEVVVSDNGGAYSAVDALSSIHDPRLKVFRHSENVGFAGNINRCLEHCSHGIIKPLCDDDLIHCDFLAQAVPFVDDGTYVVADVAKFVFGKDPLEIRQPLEGVPPAETRRAGYGLDIWSLPYSACSIPSAVVFTRGFFQSLGGFDGNTITADWDFFIEACLYKNVVHVKRTLCHVGVWEGSLTEEMLEKPFFYPQAGLYTKIRVLRCKRLSLAQHAGLWLALLKGFAWQGMRPLRRLGNPAYRKGFREYSRRFFELFSQDLDRFGARPNR